MLIKKFTHFFISKFFLFSKILFRTSAKAPVVLLTDFGIQDGAVSAMKGVILTVDRESIIVDLTHHIEPFHILEASYRLVQAMPFYPKGTVFICVVDPGVGTNRRSIVVQTKNDYYVVTPDNGLLSYVEKKFGISSVRTIDEQRHFLRSSYQSHTFYGRDLYAHIGAKLAAHVISFQEVGPALLQPMITMRLTEPVVTSSKIQGDIIVLDTAYGNLWTNIEADYLKKLEINRGDILHVKVYRKNKLMYQSDIFFGNTFGDVEVGLPIAYLNSMGSLAIAINQDSIAKKHDMKEGDMVWITVISKKILLNEITL